MPSYLLPCTCGQKTRVSTAEAGRSVHCVCGARLDVPSMRELRELAPAEPVAASRRARSMAAWSNRHRVAFVLLLAALGCLTLVGYLALRLPPELSEPSPQEVENWLKTSSPTQAVDMYEALKTGIGPTTIEPTSAISRKVILWGMGLALVACAGLLVAAMVILRKAKKS